MKKDWKIIFFAQYVGLKFLRYVRNVIVCEHKIQKLIMDLYILKNFSVKVGGYPSV